MYYQYGRLSIFLPVPAPHLSGVFSSAKTEELPRPS
jgi:hypothetical protein